MCKIPMVFMLVLLPFLGFSEGLDYAKAPKDFLGYEIGSGYADTVGRLKQNGTAFTEGIPLAQGTVKSLNLTKQTFDQVTGVSVKLVFSNENLYQITAIMDYKKDTLQNVLSDFSGKFGQVSSNDGGYTYTWFYFQKNHTMGEVPDFAVVVNSDPVTNLKITVTFIDNAVKNTKPEVPTATVKPAPGTPEVTPTPVPTPVASVKPTPKVVPTPAPSPLAAAH